MVMRNRRIDTHAILAGFRCSVPDQPAAYKHRLWQLDATGRATARDTPATTGYSY
jgi:hypothetical protein